MIGPMNIRSVEEFLDDNPLEWMNSLNFECPDTVTSDAGVTRLASIMTCLRLE